MSRSQEIPSNKDLKLLYAVSSVGLGHVRRSIAIARKLPAEVTWLTAEPGLSYLKSASEKRILPVSHDLQSMSDAMEREASAGKISDMSRVARSSSRIARANYLLIRPYLRDYDVLIQDEFAETMFSFLWDRNARSSLPPRLVVITDYVRFETRSANPLNRLILYYANRALKRAFLSADLRLFADDLDSLPDDRNLRRFTSENFEILGPIVGEIPTGSKVELRSKLLSKKGKNGNNVIVFSVGGTSIGRPLLEFVLANARGLSTRLDASLVLLSGPRVEGLDDPSVQIVPFTPDVLPYFKMADCVVTQAGASTLNEVASVGVPCVAVPIQNHWEQQSNAKRFHDKFHFPTVQYEELSVSRLVSEIKAAITMQKQLDVDYGAKERPEERAAKLIMNMCTK